MSFLQIIKVYLLGKFHSLNPFNSSKRITNQRCLWELAMNWHQNWEKQLWIFSYSDMSSLKRVMVSFSASFSIYGLPYFLWQLPLIFCFLPIIIQTWHSEWESLVKPSILAIHRASFRNRPTRVFFLVLPLEGVVLGN